MIGPYARQIVPSYDGNGQPAARLKFWFAFRDDRGGATKRYEALLGKGDKSFAMRHRPYFGSNAPKYGASFHDYRLPEDVSAFPCASLDRGQTLSEVALAMLRGEDIADVTRMRLVGAIPTRQAWQQTGDDPCISKLPQLF